MEAELANQSSSRDVFQIQTVRAIPRVSTAFAGTLATVDQTPNAESKTINRFVHVNKDSTVTQRLNASRLNAEWTTIVQDSILASTGNVSRCVRLTPAVNKPNVMHRIIVRFANVCQDMKEMHESAVNC